jgi:UDP-3-O-[3-hydroxymyristoyl] glucosamine N-acyltransferase
LQLTVSDIAAQVQGRVQGDGAAVIRGVAGLTEAGAADLAFVRDARNADAAEQFKQSKAGAVLVPKGFVSNGRTVIEVDNPIAAFAHVLGLVARETQHRPDGVSAGAHIDPSAKLGQNVRIGPGCVVEKDAVIGDGACLVAQVYVGARSRVGDNTVLYPQVVLREDVTVGRNCILHPGAVIGADGYGFFFAGGRHNKIPHVGGVRIEDDVEIGANTCVDRAMTGLTVVGRGTKIDNLVQVAHNVQIGPLCLLVSQAGVAGSSRLGTGVVLAGQVGVADHVTIGDGAKLGAQSGVAKDVPAGQEYFGAPAQPVGDAMRQLLSLRRLPELLREFKKLKETMGKHV